jgi:4-carboxymuconolactone decarboxylase
VERDQLPLDQRRFHDAVQAIRRRPISGPFIVTMNGSPDLAARFAHLGHYFHARGQADESIVPIRLRAFVSLVGSRALDAPYEWAAWVNWALDAGIPQSTVDAIREGKLPQELTADEVLVAELCSQMLAAGNGVDDATFQRALQRFGAQGMVELVVTLGYFAMIALPLNAFEIEMSAAQMKQRKAFAPLPVGGSPWEEVQTSADARLPWPCADSGPRLVPIQSHADLAPGDQHFFDRVVRTRGWIAPVYEVLLHSPDVAERIACIGEFFLYQSLLPAAPKALAWLVTARELACAYTWSAGVCAASSAGLDSQLIEAIEHGRTLAHASGEQKVVVAFCRQLLRGNHRVSDAIYRAAVDSLGLPATIQLATAAGYVAMMSLIAHAFAIRPSADETMPAL